MCGVACACSNVGKHRASIAFLVPRPHRLGHEHPSVRCRFAAFVPGTQPRFAGTRTRCPATPGYRPASATPWPPRLFSTHRLIWVWLYRIRPQVLNTMVLVKPATVVQWHRLGFRLYWWHRSRRLGRPSITHEIRDLIRKMSLANPLWGAPRIHGELLKLGVQVSQATVGRDLPWRPKVPSPTWRSFLHNHQSAESHQSASALAMDPRLQRAECPGAQSRVARPQHAPYRAHSECRAGAVRPWSAGPKSIAQPYLALVLRSSVGFPASPWRRGVRSPGRTVQGARHGGLPDRRDRRAGASRRRSRPADWSAPCTRRLLWWRAAGPQG